MPFPKKALVLSPLTVVALAALSCAKPSSPGATRRDAPPAPLLEKIGPAPKEGTGGNGAARSNDGTRRFVARFDEADDARRKAEELAARGATVTTLHAEGRILSVEAPEMALEGVTVPATTRAASNARFRLTPPAGAHTSGRGGRGIRGERGSVGGPASIDDGLSGFDPRDASSGSADDALTVADALGLNALRARVPGADGRGMRVAVLDTGIDFGIPGLSRTRSGKKGKLAGFYDLTPFGRVSLLPTKCAAPTEGCAVSGGTRLTTLKFAGPLAGARVAAIGVLSERSQANAIFSSEADFDGDGESDGLFAVARGRDGAGEERVWIDLDGNGLIEDPAREQLGDFNATGDSVVARVEADDTGARIATGQIAATLSEKNDVQFHSVAEMHGTGVASLIAGDGLLGGKLDGMAPKADLLSYVIDAAGNDGYALDTLLSMFLHARDKGATAVNASWGFATADLAAARFLADTLDEELAAKGVLVGIAAGNAGPAVSTSGSDDYIPRWGFGVAAALTGRQAKNVYGNTEEPADTVVNYSSVGPTRGGRLVPDITSPLISLVRNNRTGARAYVPFSGTSSATPAFIGAATSLMSALRNAGEESIDMRLLKRALVSTARKFDGIEGIRQGAGMADVNAAFDVYRRLSAEARRTVSGKGKEGELPYALRAAVPADVPGAATLEGLRRVGVPDPVVVDLNATWLRGLAPLDRSSDALADLVRVSHSGTFLRTRHLLPLGEGRNTLALGFDATALSKPGVYSDVIELRRSKDDLLVASIPVVITIPRKAGADGAFARIDETLGANGLVRVPVEIGSRSEIVFDGAVTVAGAGEGASVQWVLADLQGRVRQQARVETRRGVGVVAFRSGVIEPGVYELTIFNGAATASPKATAHVTGTLAMPLFTVAETERVTASNGRQGAGLEILVRNDGAPLDARARWKATLAFGSVRETVELAPATENGVKGYASATIPTRPANLSAPEEAGYAVTLSQGLRALTDEGFSEMAAAVIDATGQVHAWDWLNVFARAGATGGADLAWPAEGGARIFVYPNVGRLDYARTPRLVATLASAALDSNGEVIAPVEATSSIVGSQASRSGDAGLLLSFDLPKSLRRKGFEGTLTLASDRGDSREANIVVEPTK